MALLCMRVFGIRNEICDITKNGGGGVGKLNVIHIVTEQFLVCYVAIILFIFQSPPYGK